MTTPTITGLTTSVTFDENTVNATPQIIDSDVTVADSPDDNFDGGMLTVSGLLAEDTVSINNQGTGAGQIGFSGGNVTYGGVTIGTATGGDGATLTVTFNANATTAAIEALIQNLTYANASDAPTASRTLTITLTDAGGDGDFARPDRRRQPAQRHRRRLDAKATFGDLDGDGDLDMMVGENGGTILYYKNTGSASAPVFAQQTGAANPFNGSDVGCDSAPALVDLDGDGDLDLVVGENDGNLNYFKNTGTASAPVFAAADRRRQPVQRRSTRATTARRPSPTSTATATSTWWSAARAAACSSTRTPARRPRRPSPRTAARSSTASTSAAARRRRSATSTATATSTSWSAN